MFDPDQFEERAAIMEFDGGLSRYQAEVEAAKAQGVPRWKALQEVQNAKCGGNSEQGRNIGQPLVRDSSDDMPGVQHDTAQQVGPVPVGDVQAGRRDVALPSLRTIWRGIL